MLGLLVSKVAPVPGGGYVGTAYHLLSLRDGVPTAQAYSDIYEKRNAAFRSGIGSVDRFRVGYSKSTPH